VPTDAVSRAPNRSSASPERAEHAVEEQVTAITREKLARSRPRPATIGFRNGSTAWRMPVEMNSKENPAIHQP
jgi:hypothetical protein